MVSIGILWRAAVSSKRVRFIRHFLHLQIYIYIGISLAPFLYTSSRNFSLKLLHYIYVHEAIAPIDMSSFFFHFFTFNPTRETVYKSLRLCFYFIHSRRREKGH